MLGKHLGNKGLRKLFKVNHSGEVRWVIKTTTEVKRNSQKRSWDFPPLKICTESVPCRSRVRDQDTQDKWLLMGTWTLLASGRPHDHTQCEPDRATGPKPSVPELRRQLSSSRPVWSTNGILGQPGLHRETPGFNRRKGGGGGGEGVTAWLPCAL